jgi:hypothetical protein
MTTRRYTAQFAAVTLDLEQQLKGSSPCAKALVRWLLLALQAWMCDRV